ncbi:phospholipase D-like domain-containing protein [Paraburkholderia sp. J11-2]|uniref:phospholipase D-like domain-containing protein n=1 Tax=Paraburkholderia sp. J11-2 TaxID=2805431 RepID=UPI002AB7A625|nr:phospholipase D-like domain-containing protein [Paraburkholderia sp. J11-2]
MSVKLISLIDKARPRRALFTTFTFSISWFEAILIPALRRAGCEQIDVLVDARYARRSTDEASGLYIGSAYRVIPVYMARTTVFHPKLVYLDGFDDADRLVVSSANLTLSGHGKNLEVLDAISAAEEPGVLGEFAEFLDALTAKYDFSADYGEILSGYSTRIRSRIAKLGQVNDADRRAWLVHTLSRTAAEQLTEHAYRLDNPHTLTVLSPFHSPTGSPVQELADEIGVSKIRIGLDAKNPVAPFLKDGNAFDAVPGFVRADTDHFERTLHAKCFEVKGDDGVVVMTGSVNATAQSLASTDNVEVSLVRLLDETPFAWKKLDKPKEYKPCEFNVDELSARNPALQVSLTPDNRLVGQMFPSGPDQRVTLEVLDGDVSRHTQQNTPMTNGAFDVRLHRTLSAENSLQLIVTGEDLYAVGWINVELDLRTNPSQRDLAKASARLLAGEHRNADLDQITNWLLALQSRQKPTGTPGPRPGGAGQKSKAPPARKMTYAEWRKSIEEAQGATGQPAVSRNAIEAAIQWVNRDVKKRTDIPDLKAPEPKDPRGKPEGKPCTPGQPDTPPGMPKPKLKPRFIASEDEEYSQQPGEPANNDEAKESEERFLQALEAIPRGLELDARGSIVPLLVELSATQVLKLTLNTLGPVEDSGRQTSQLPLIQGWLNRFARFDYSEQNREALMPLFAAMVCCAAEFHGDVALPSLKEALVRLLGRALEAGEVLESATLGLESDRFERLSDEGKQMALTRANAVETSSTNSDVLTDLIVLTLDPQSRTCPTVAPEYTPVVRALHRYQRQPSSKAFGVVRDGVQASAAPCCGGPLHSDDMTILRARRQLVCKECKRPIFYGLDPAVLEERGLTNRFKV